ncbi:MaoC/PaaZ C-terminal domain-containing protein [Nocardioides sp.]|uniref:MaoC/PaaZ C-terminal domain-containing protein n=1 Tax=Nocardioides sp. TaxID=35761 RepID=UPI00260FF404|nr:MaoC/PaaZ C-terminal domain-containing protein [Nocardioides sp.]
MSGQVHLEDVQVGDVVTPLRVSVDETQMFLFSAATYNAHRIHYDKTWAREKEGYDDVLVQGPLQAALLARAVTDWIGPGGRLVTFSAQNRAVAFPGQELTFSGTVTAIDATDPAETRVELDLAATRGGDVLMPGTAVVVLPRRGPAGAL